MSGPVRSLLFGLTAKSQALEAGRLGVDGVVVAVGGPDGVSGTSATEIVQALPPLVARWAWPARGEAVPQGFSGVVTGTGDPRPDGAPVRVVRLSSGLSGREAIPNDAEAVWVPNPTAGTSSLTRRDYPDLGEFSRRHRLILELPDPLDGLEIAIRLARPYAVLFGQGVWFRPGIVDLDRLEEALAALAQLNQLLRASD